jgi:hypothetical protein
MHPLAEINLNHHQQDKSWNGIENDIRHSLKINLKPERIMENKSDLKNYHKTF